MSKQDDKEMLAAWSAGALIIAVIITLIYTACQN
jgi:hypothetical protein